MHTSVNRFSPHRPRFRRLAAGTVGAQNRRALTASGYNRGERYQGPLVKNPDGSDNYEIEATQTQAAGLKGRLLLIHGTMDANVPPYNTLLVADALIKANKDFDMLRIPNSGHGYTPANYVMRRRWDYFVKYLLDAEPPARLCDPASAGRRGPSRQRRPLTALNRRPPIVAAPHASVVRPLSQSFLQEDRRSLLSSC